MARFEALPLPFQRHTRRQGRLADLLRPDLLGDDPLPAPARADGHGHRRVVRRTPRRMMRDTGVQTVWRGCGALGSRETAGRTGDYAAIPVTCPRQPYPRVK